MATTVIENGRTFLVKVVGRTPGGPYPLQGTPHVPPEVEIVDLRLNAVALPADVIRGLLEPFNGRARSVLVAMLRGCSEGRAAMAGGISTSCLDRWRRDHSEFSEACITALSFGFHGVAEDELYERALAGSADRGSMRALELVVKARNAAYRDKVQGQIDVVHHAAASRARLVSGYDGERPGG